MDLKKAIKEGLLDQFIKERDQDLGDKKQFDSTLSSMVGKSKEVPVTSSRDKTES